MTGNHPAANRRRNLRAPVTLPVAWRNTADGEIRLGSTIDLSASGMALRSPISVPRGTRIYVVVGNPELGLRFEAAAAVARARKFEGEYLLSLAFTSISPDVAAAIGRSVVRALSEARDGGGTPDAEVSSDADEPKPTDVGDDTDDASRLSA